MAHPDDDSGVTTVAKEQAGEVGRTAADAGGTVAQTTKEQAQQVVGEAKQQARDLIGEARTQAADQANSQKGRAVDGLRGLGGELDHMAEQGGRSGLATEVARQAAQRAHALADHLDRHEPADLLDQVRSYARRRPVVFLAGAALAGVVAGRLTRNLADTGSDAPGSDLARPVSGPVAEPVVLPAGGYAGPAGALGSGGYADSGPAGGYAEPGPAGGYAEPVGGYGDAVPVEPVPVEPAYPGGGYQPGTEPGYDTPGYPRSEPPARGTTP